jgi:hypothetical protein
VLDDMIPAGFLGVQVGNDEHHLCVRVPAGPCRLQVWADPDRPRELTVVLVNAPDDSTTFQGRNPLQELS